MQQQLHSNMYNIHPYSNIYTTTDLQQHIYNTSTTTYLRHYEQHLYSNTHTSIFTPTFPQYHIYNDVSSTTNIQQHIYNHIPTPLFSQ